MTYPSLLCLILAAMGADANNSTIAGKFVVEHPTLSNLGFEWEIHGDANRNATVTVQFRAVGETAWRQAMPLVRMGGEQVYRRLSALHRFLVDALRETEPERAVVERLARFLDAGVVIFTGAGEPEFVAGDAPVADLGRAVAALPGGPAELEIAGYQAVATTVASRAGRPVRWLALATRRTGFVTRLIKPAAETAWTSSP